MKKWLTVLSLTLVVAILVPMTAFAATEEPDADISAVVTVDGDVYALDGAPAVEALGGFDSYTILAGEEEILGVEPSGDGDADETAGEEASGGFYSVRFPLPETTKEVFLTGLTASRVEEIQEKLIQHYAEGPDFDLEDLSFIDVEKTLPEDGDENLCWAATSSNLLTYTGWAAQAGFDTTDDVFDAFVNAFEDKGGNPYYGIGWFFNGVNRFGTSTEEAASAAEGTGGYIADYAFEQYVGSVNIVGDSVSGFRSLRDHLDSGDGISLDVTLINTHTGNNSGHSMTCWGYVIDTDHSENEAGYNAGLLLTDSDSDWVKEGDRRGAPNILHVISLASAGSGAELDYYFRLPGYIAYVDDFNYLQPYADTLTKETCDDATRDKVTTPDLYISDAYFGTDTAAAATKLEKIKSNTRFYFTPIVRNMADADYSGPLQVYTEVTGADGVVMTDNEQVGVSIPAEGGLSFGTSVQRPQGLPAGDYTMTFYLNREHPAEEAYYYNNVFSFDFKVRDSYIIGDVNGDGDVDVLDATTIQRILAEYEVSATDGYMERAILNGVERTDITFATTIQRWLVDYEVAYPIGESTLYNGIY